MPPRPTSKNLSVPKSSRGRRRAEPKPRKSKGAKAQGEPPSPQLAMANVGAGTNAEVQLDPLANARQSPIPNAIVPDVAVAAAANNSNYRDEEVENLLQKVLKFKPYTDEGWNRVYAAFLKETVFPPRTLKSLMEKYRKLKDMKKPTGNPKAHEFHEMALKCEREICALTATFGIDDPPHSDDDIEITGTRRISPEWDADILQIDSDSEEERAPNLDIKPKIESIQAPAAAYIAASSKAGKRRASHDLPQRVAPVARREPAKSVASRSNANQLAQSFSRLVDNTSPEIERALNNQRHQDELSRVQLVSLMEEVRALRAQLDAERDRRAELSAKLQKYELLDEMRRMAGLAQVVGQVSYNGTGSEATSTALNQTG